MNMNTPSPSMEKGPAAAESAVQKSKVQTPPPAATASSPTKPNGRKHWLLLAALAFAGVAAVAAGFWIGRHRTHSETDDAFVESHIVNLAPQMVSGHILRFYAEENDRVTQGQVVAEIDPVPYRDKVRLAQSKVEGAEAELQRQEANLARVKAEVPIQIEIAKQTLGAAKVDEAKAWQSLTLTTEEVEKSILEARAGVKATEADLVMAELDYKRFEDLSKRQAASVQRFQQATRSRDNAVAQKNLAEAKLAKAVAARTQIELAKHTIEEAEKTTKKAVQGVALAETGNDQIREIALLTNVKREMLKEVKRGLDAAQNELNYTQIRAPFSGVVVKRYRNLGDFVSAGSPILSMVNPDLLYVTANLEETRLPGVSPGCQAALAIDAFSEPFVGRVVWINKSTGAQFALMPRNVVAGEFTKVVQRVPVRIWIERDARWPQLRAGLSVHVSIRHGQGDAKWAQQAAQAMAKLESSSGGLDVEEERSPRGVARLYRRTEP
jgi:membrane fusion protein, multidrug efflux system